MALGLNILVGNTGQISPGHAGFVAYVAAFLLQMGVPFLLTLIMAGSIYALMALAMSITYKASEIPNFAQGEIELENQPYSIASTDFISPKREMFGLEKKISRT